MNTLWYFNIYVAQNWHIISSIPIFSPLLWNWFYNLFACTYMKALREQIDNQWAVTSKQKMEHIFATNQHLPIKVHIESSICFDRISIKIALKGNLNLIYVWHFGTSIFSFVSLNGIQCFEFNWFSTGEQWMYIRNGNKNHKSILMICKRISNLKSVFLKLFYANRHINLVQMAIFFTVIDLSIHN